MVMRLSARCRFLAVLAVLTVLAVTVTAAAVAARSLETGLPNSDRYVSPIQGVSVVVVVVVGGHRRFGWGRPASLQQGNGSDFKWGWASGAWITQGRFQQKGFYCCWYKDKSRPL